MQDKKEKIELKDQHLYTYQFGNTIHSLVVYDKGADSIICLHNFLGKTSNELSIVKDISSKIRPEDIFKPWAGKVELFNEEAIGDLNSPVTLLYDKCLYKVRDNMSNSTFIGVFSSHYYHFIVLVAPDNAYYPPVLSCVPVDWDRYSRKDIRLWDGKIEISNDN